MTNFPGMTKIMLFILPLLISGADDTLTDSSDDNTRDETTTDSSYSINDLAISWTEPSLNKEACGSLSDDVTITLTTSQILNNAKFYAWFPDSGSECSNVATTTDNQVVNGTAVSSLLSSHEEIVTLTYQTLYDQVNTDSLDVCTTDTGGTEVKLCFLIDIEEGTALNPTNPDGAIDATEPNGWVLFTIDTLAPPAPDTPTITSKDSALFVSAAVTDDAEGVESDDIASWVVRYREATDSELTTDDKTETETETEAGDETEVETTPTCNDWADYSEKSATDYGTSTTIEVSATNGVEYELCVFAVDGAGNRSLPSDSANGTPIDECDFMECYPGTIKTGHCAATGTQIWIWALFGAFAFLRRRFGKGERHE